MKTFFKLLVSLLLLAVLAVAGFLYFFDANDYKDELADAIEAGTQRPVNIAGDAKVVFYPWLGIRVYDVSIDNPPKFGGEKFAKVEEFEVKVEILPLLQKRLNVETLLVRGLQLNLLEKDSGWNNWDDFVGDEDDDDDPRPGLSGFTVSSFEVTDAKVTYRNVDSGKQYTFTNLKLATQMGARGQPQPLALNAFVKSNMPEWESSVVLKTDLVLRDDSPIFNANNLKLVVKALLPSSDLEKVTVAMIANGEVNLENHTAKLLNAKLSALGMVMSGDLTAENIFGVPTIYGPIKVNKFNAHDIADKFKVTIPELRNTDSLKTIVFRSDFKTDFSSINLDDIVATIDQSHVKGFLHINDTEPYDVKYYLDIEKLTLQDYFLADDRDDVFLPVDFIRAGKFDGKIDIASLVIDDTELQSYSMVSMIKDNVFKGKPVSMTLDESKVVAEVEYVADTLPVATSKIKVTNLTDKDSINPWLMEMTGSEDIRLEGIGSADIEVKAKGESVNALKKSATGLIRFNIDNPVIIGIDLDHATRKIAADYANKNNFRTRKSFITDLVPGKRNEFKSLTATFDLQGSQLINKALVILSDEAKITGTGKIDLSTRKLEYRPVIDVAVEDAVDIRDKLRDHPMEYQVKGSFGNLTTRFDANKYELLVGRKLVMEAKEKRIRKEVSGSKNSWTNVKSK